MTVLVFVVEIATLAAAAASLVGIALLFVRFGRVGTSIQTALEPRLASVEQAASKSERVVREEAALSRAEAERTAKSLREEVTGSFRDFGGSITASFSTLSTSQRDQLSSFATSLADWRTAADANAMALRQEVAGTLGSTAETIRTTITELGAIQKERLDRVAGEVVALTTKSGEQQEALRKIVGEKLDAIRSENAAKLEEMRRTVDEKLQSTLEQRLGASFELVSKQLEAVHKSVGEMQNLATGVGDLKRVLTNVKARGMWGEVMLGGLLEQFMTIDQYAQNVEIRAGSGQRIEYAVRMPGQGDVEGAGELWLPIDSKFPQEDYERLVDASHQGDPVAMESAIKALETRIRLAAKDIRDKYIEPPFSTDFAILFLPTEGLYAEVVRRPGLMDALQRECRVLVTGPSTLVAFLSSLQMGFRTLAIQKRSSEVWQVLSAVKTEFANFGCALEKVRKKLTEATGHIDKVGVRQRAITRKLRDVQTMPEGEAVALLGVVDVDEAEELATEEVA